MVLEPILKDMSEFNFFRMLLIDFHLVNSLWTYIAEIFNRETGKQASVEKLRKLFTRLRDQKKKVDRNS